MVFDAHFKKLPVEINWHILSYLSIKDIARFSRVDLNIYNIVNGTLWQYKLPPDEQTIHRKTFRNMIIDVNNLKSSLKLRNSELRKELFWLKICGDPDNDYDKEQVRHACIAAGCGCLCGACIPLLWSSNFYFCPSLLLSSFFGVGCMFESCSSDEKHINEVYHESREVRLAPIYKRIKDEQEQIKQTTRSLPPRQISMIK